MLSGRPLRSPITFTLTPESCKFATSCLKNCSASSNMPFTSSSGLLQFSVEKAYRVRNFTPMSLQYKAISLAFLVPSEWPISLGMPCLLAQRPFPSMTIHICSGTLVNLNPASRHPRNGRTWPLNQVHKLLYVYMYPFTLPIITKTPDKARVFGSYAI